MYDARFGRWLSVDPYGQFWSPYVGMGNAPNMGTDPDGGLFGLGPVASGALIGAAVGTAAGLIFDPDHWYLWTAGGAGLGALGGAVYNSSTYNLTGIGRTGKGGGRIAKSSGSTGSAGGGINVPAINFPSIATATWESILRFERGEYHRPDDFPTWDMVTNRRIRELHPRLGIAARQFINTVEGELGIQLRITQGYRSIAEQDALYAQGRTAPGEIVTNARGGQSYHNYGLAFDVVEMANGRANWNTTMENWGRIGAIGQRFGLEWGGNWTTFVDRPHFQMTFGHTIRQLMQLHGVRIGPTR